MLKTARNYPRDIEKIGKKKIRNPMEAEALKQTSKTAIEITKTRNIVVIGGSGSGKSNLANRVMGTKAFKVFHGDSSGTQWPEFSEVIHRRGEIEYRIKLMDTAGFFDTFHKSDTSIKKAIREAALEKMGDGINTLILVMKAEKYTDQEKQVIKLVMETFGEEISSRTIAVITHCESMTQEAREFKVKERKNSDDYIKKVNKVIAVGFPDLDNCPVYLHEGYTQSAQSDVKIIREFIYECGTQMNPALATAAAARSGWFCNLF